MQIAALVHTHGCPRETEDTVASIVHYMTPEVMLVVDGLGWDQFATFPAPAIHGFNHGYHRAPYRNTALGLWTLARHFPDRDWYCYLEYDCLVGSAGFFRDLRLAQRHGYWLCANDHRIREEKKVNLSWAERMLGMKFATIEYVLGACVFYSGKFMTRALEERVFEKLLHFTNDFAEGFFPGYVGKAAWDLTEHLMPTLAKHWGGRTCQFARWDNQTNTWSGNYRKYPIRWQPDLLPIEDEFAYASILHPLKDYDHPAREFHRRRRNLVGDSGSAT